MWLMKKYFCAVSVLAWCSSAFSCFFNFNQISLSRVSNGGYGAKKGRNNADHLLSLGVNIFLLMPMRLSEGGNSLNISVTPAVGISSPAFVHFVEKQGEKNVHISAHKNPLCRWTVTRQWQIWTRHFIVKTVKYIFSWIFEVLRLAATHFQF